MTALANKTPLSVDYTGRDYYALREELIARVKDRTNGNWQGTDPSDFGLAIVEAFAYMGDLINYYIDRIANESYIETATQRESLLNLSKIYGYKPNNYISSIVDIFFTSNNGYNGQIAAGIIEDGTINASTYSNVFKIIVPNDSPFEIGDTVNVSGVPTVINTFVGRTPVVYDGSVFNGSFKVLSLGYNSIGKNVIWYQPVSDVSAVSINGTSFTVTYTGSLNAVEGQRIKLTNVTVGSGNNYNGVWTVKSTTESTETGINATFTVDSTTNNVAITRVRAAAGTITFSGFNLLSGYADFIVGQKVTITGIKSSNNTGGTAGVAYNIAGATVASVKNSSATITKAVYSGSVGNKTVTYNSSKLFTENDIITISGVTSQQNPATIQSPLGDPNLGFNFTDVTVASVSTTTKTVSLITPGSSVPTASTYGIIVINSAAHGFTLGQYVDITGVSSQDSTGNPTSVYNIAKVKIVDVSTDTISINAFFTDIYTGGGTLSSHTFALTGVNRTDDFGAVTGGVAVCRQFQVTNAESNTVTDVTGATAVALIGGTYSSGGKVYYAPLPNYVYGGGASIGVVRTSGFDVVPKGTQVTAPVSTNGNTTTEIFTILSDAAVPYRGAVNVIAVQGEDVSLRSENSANTASVGYDIAGEKIGTSNGTSNQSFVLKEKRVNINTVKVYVDNGVAFEKWAQVQYVIDYTGGDNVYSVTIDSDNNVYVNFGDGVAGAIPTKESTIKAVYIAGGGTVGNVGAGVINSFGAIPLTSSAATALKSVIIGITNPLPATGGADPETNDSIRLNAPRALRSLNRAVTLQDFSDLALSVPGVAKANATATNRSNVTLYVAPTQSGTSDIYPGYLNYGDDANIQSSQLRFLIETSIPEFMGNKTQIGTSLTIVAPYYTDIFMDISYSTLPQYSGAVVESYINEALVNAFTFEDMQFADIITPEEVEFKLRQVTGVQNAKVISLYRFGGSGRNTLVGTADEVFVVQEGGITLTQASPVSTLSAITLVAKNSSGSVITPVVFSRTFNSGVYRYGITVPATTSSLTIDATTTAGAATVTINNSAGTNEVITAATSGVLFPAPITINVTAPDGVTVSSYVLSVTSA